MHSIDMLLDLTAEQLLEGSGHAQLLTCLECLLNSKVRVVDPSGKVLLGCESKISGYTAIPVVVDFEPIAYLEAKTDVEKHKTAASLLAIHLRSQARYKMAAALHTEAVHDDFEKLLKKNEALVQSEARYKALAENLEKRVDEQVDAIETTRRQLYESEKLAAVGQLAAGVAHEINNPIGFIGSNLKTARHYVDKLIAATKAVNTEPPEPPEPSSHSNLDFMVKDFIDLIDESSEGCDRIARIVKDLKDFSSIDSAKWSPCDINALIISVCNVSQGAVPDNIKIDLHLGEIPNIPCQAGHISQVLYHLLTNAADALKTVSTGGMIGFETHLDDAAIVIAVSDNGQGIPENILSKIFLPFFTTKPVGQGTGLGLTVCHDVVKNHQGRIKVESSPDKGTKVYIWLPITTEASV